MTETKRMGMTVGVLPAAKKAYDLIRPNLDILLMNQLKSNILRQLKEGQGDTDLNLAVQILNDLNREIYENTGYPTPATPYRIKDGYLWFKTLHKDGSYYWHTVVGQGEVSLSEPAEETISNLL